MITLDHKVDNQQFYLTVHVQFIQELSSIQLKWSDLEEVALWPQIHKVPFVSLVTLNIQTEIQDCSHYITIFAEKFSYFYSLKHTFSNDDKLPVSLNFAVWR